MNKFTTIAGWVSTGLATAVLLFSAYGKFFMDGMEANMTRYGLADWLTIIGIGELASTILFIIPKTSRYGLLLLSSYLGGAIVTHMSQGESFLFPTVTLLFVWIGGILRHPQFYKFGA